MGSGDTAQIVEKFNEFFVSISPNLNSNITCCAGKNQAYLNSHISTSFHFKLINKKDTEKYILSLLTKTSSGHDWISTKFLKILSTGLLIEPVTLIVNQSVITGIFPEKLTWTKMIPLYKKDDKLIMDNYLPISLLTSISKLFVKVAFEQLSDYFSSNNYWHDGQYSFRGKDSSVSIIAIERNKVR